VNNTLTILVFGQLTDIIGGSKTVMEPVENTDLLVEQLQQQFPLLKEARYVITVDRKIVRQNTMIGEGSEIALLPPFSGG